MFVEWHKNRTWRSLYNVVVKAMSLRAASNCNWSQRGSFDLYINSIVSIEWKIHFYEFFLQWELAQTINQCFNRSSMRLVHVYGPLCRWSSGYIILWLYKILQLYSSQRHFRSSQRHFHCTHLVIRTRNAFLDIKFAWWYKRLHVMSIRSGYLSVGIDKH